MTDQTRQAKLATVKMLYVGTEDAAEAGRKLAAYADLPCKLAATALTRAARKAQAMGWDEVDLPFFPATEGTKLDKITQTLDRMGATYAVFDDRITLDTYWAKTAG